MADAFYYSEHIDGAGSSFADDIYYHGGHLLIFTAHGDSLCYEDVPKEVFDGFKEADSIGRYYHSHIRGKYPFAHSGNDLFVEPIRSLWTEVEQKKAEMAEVDAPSAAKGKHYSVYVTFDSLEKASTFLSYAEADSIAASLHVEDDRL